MKKDPSTKVGGNEGMILSRCAFVCMLALNHHKGKNNYTTFMTMLNQFEISIELAEGDTQNQINKVIMEDLQQLDDIQPILETWKMASKMRIWLQEKRKFIANKVKSAFDEEEKINTTHHDYDDIDISYESKSKL